MFSGVQKEFLDTSMNLWSRMPTAYVEQWAESHLYLAETQTFTVYGWSGGLTAWWLRTVFIFIQPGWELNIHIYTYSPPRHPLGIPFSEFTYMGNHCLSVSTQAAPIALSLQCIHYKDPPQHPHWESVHIYSFSHWGLFIIWTIHPHPQSNAAAEVIFVDCEAPIGIYRAASSASPVIYSSNTIHLRGCSSPRFHV